VSPVDIELDDKSTYLRLMLYYKEDLIEDETVKRVAVVPSIAEETTNKIPQQIGIEVSGDIFERKTYPDKI